MLLSATEQEEIIIGTIETIPKVLVNAKAFNNFIFLIFIFS
ncbi:Uncharacterised protein [Chlamydia trachomatis]|nr:Uncharacterised protein [Chlamydia trachomatis]